MCSEHQKSLVYIEFNSLVINSTALQELNLRRSQVLYYLSYSNEIHTYFFYQVNCKFAYISLLSSDNYKFLPEVQKSIYIVDEVNWCQMCQFGQLVLFAGRTERSTSGAE